MDYGTRSGKSLSLGMPWHPQDNLRTPKSQSLGMPRKASPLSSTSIGNFTWSYIFIHHMICVLLGALRESWIRGCLGSWTIPSAGLQDYEDTRLKTSSRVQMGLSLAWKASLAMRIFRSPTIVTDFV